MANLSNINNKFLFTDGDFLKIGNLAPINNISSTESGISVTNSNVASITLDNTAASGKKHVMYSSGNGSLVFWDSDAASARLQIDSSGMATFSGRVNAGESFGALKDGADTVADGPFFRLTNAATTRQYLFQLDASNNIDYWYYNGSTWTQTISLLTNGGATFAGTVETTTLRTDVVNNKANSANIIYRSGTSTLVGGGSTANKLYVLDSGNVGIGTTSPSRKLVVAQSNVTEPSGIDANTGILIKNNTWSGIQIISTEATGGFITFGDNAAGFAGRIQYLHATNAMVFETAASERMRIDSSGNVGIGNTSPSDFLSWQKQLVVGNGSYDAGITIYHGSGGGNQGAIVFADGNTGTDRYRGSISYNGADEMKFFTSTLERIKINDAGNVFISTPITNAFYGLSLTYNNTNTADFTVNQATGQIKIGGVAAGYFPTFYSAGVERMRIESTGVVKFPNTATSTGDVGTIAHYTNNYMYIRGGTGGLAIGDDGFDTSIYLNNSDSIQFQTGGTEKMRITSGGRVLIGPNSSSYSSNDAITHLTGNSSNYVAYFHAEAIYAGAWRYARFMSSGNSTIAGEINGTTTTSVIYGTTSDYRMKKNVKPLENGLERLCKLKPVKFDFKENNSSAEGFIAHEVQDIFPDAIYGEKDGEKPQGMDYGRITPLLVKAIQELKADNDSLKARIETLENN